MNSAQTECDAYARDTDNGHERVLTCDLGRHSTPSDPGVVHHDPGLDVGWYYWDEGVRFDEEESGAKRRDE